MANSLPVVPQLETISETAKALDNSYGLAVILNGIVYRTMKIDAQGAALLLEQPLFVQCDVSKVSPGSVYDPLTNKFS